MYYEQVYLAIKKSKKNQYSRDELYKLFVNSSWSGISNASFLNFVSYSKAIDVLTIDGSGKKREFIFDLKKHESYESLGENL